MVGIHSYCVNDIQVESYQESILYINCFEIKYFFECSKLTNIKPIMLLRLHLHLHSMFYVNLLCYFFQKRFFLLIILLAIKTSRFSKKKGLNVKNKVLG